MKTVLRVVRPLTTSLVSIAVLAAGVMFAGPAAHASDKPIRIGLVTFLSGPAAGPFGVPARIAAEAIVESLNSGEAPAPHSSVGFSGVPIELVIIDEAGGATKQVAEFRNLVERQKVDFVIGYISSGDCLAIPPVAEELKKLTVLFDCGTPRVFEEASYKYVFRTRPHATMDAVACARYLLESRTAVVGLNGLRSVLGNHPSRHAEVARIARQFLAHRGQRAYSPREIERRLSRPFDGTEGTLR